MKPSLLEYLSVTDPVVIARCTPTARMLQEAKGVLVLLAGFFAMASSSYALSTSIDSTPIVAGGALLYGLLVVTIDRFVISGSSLWSLPVRLSLAVVVGLTVGVPVELALFKDRIEKELHTSSIAENDAFAEEEERLRRETERTIELADREIVDVDSQRRALRASAADLDARIRELEDRRDDALLRSAGEEYGQPGDGLSGVQGKGENWRYQDKRRIQAVLGLTELQPRLEAAREALHQAEARHQTALEARWLAAEAADDSEERQRQSARERLFVPQSRDLLSRYEALERVKMGSPGARFVGWLIRLLFLIFELAPAIIKMTSTRGEYELIVRAEAERNAALIHELTRRSIEHLKEPRTGQADHLAIYLAEHPFDWGARARALAFDRLVPLDDPIEWTEPGGEHVNLVRHQTSGTEPSAAGETWW